MAHPWNGLRRANTGILFCPLQGADLGAWASGSYVIPVVNLEDKIEDDSESHPQLIMTTPDQNHAFAFLSAANFLKAPSLSEAPEKSLAVAGVAWDGCVTIAPAHVSGRRRSVVPATCCVMGCIRLF